MNKTDDSDKGICILSLDSGASGTYSQLLLIKECMRHIASNQNIDEQDILPTDYFDLMGGVGFGGLAVFMLGYVRMNVSQAIEALLTITSATFSGDCNEKKSPGRSMKDLRASIEDLLETWQIPLQTKMFDKARPTNCRVAIYSATSADASHCRVFRTYATRGASLNPTIVEALCATMATHPFFPPVKIGPRLREESFIGGPIGANNPTRELLHEASVVFGDDTRVAQIISIGAGTSNTLSLDSVQPTEVADTLLKTLILDCQMVASELSTRLINTNAYVRLNADFHAENWSMDDWSGLGTIEKSTGAYIKTVAVHRTLEELGRYLQEKTGTVTLGQINFSTSIKSAFKTPPAVSPYFVVRSGAWTHMVHSLVDLPSSNQKVFVITGMAGCGKTQLVSYFLQENRSRFSHVVFVDASSPLTIKSDLQAWSRSLGDAHEQDVWEDALRTLSSEPKSEQWILVLDNADDPDMDLTPFLPNCYHGTVIITSRNRDTGNMSNTHHLELGEMEADEAISAILKAARRKLAMPAEELSDLHTLIEHLGYLAVAIVQAGTYCYQLSVTFTAYLSQFLIQRVELMGRAESSALDEYQRGAYTAFDLSYKAIPESAKEFFHFASSFHYANVPLFLFAIAAHYNFLDPSLLLPRPKEHENTISDLNSLLCTDGEWNEVQAHQHIRTLRSFSLVSASSMRNTVFIHFHPLVHAWSRDMLSTFRRYSEMGIQVLTTCTTGKDIQIFQYLLPHYLDLLDRSAIEDVHVNDQMGAGVVLNDQGSGDRAEKIFLNILNILRRTGDSPGAVTVAGWLAVVYDSQGNWTAAEELKLEILDLQTRMYGEGDLGTIQTLANLASTYDYQGRWEEAEPIKLKVLEERTRLLGRSHPDTVDIMQGLTITYFELGRWSEVERFALEAITQRPKSLLTSPVQMIDAAEKLTLAYSTQGRWVEAGELQQVIVDRRRKLLGVDHPRTLVSAGNLARHLAEQGRWAEAELLEVDTLERQRKVHGNEHPDTIMAAANLARTLAEQGRWDSAEELEVEVLKLRQKLFPAEHPYTIRAAANLSITYRQQGRLEDSEALCLEALEQRTRILGREHFDTLRSAADLAVVFRLQGRLQEAEDLGLKVLKQERRVMGPSHANTVGVEANLALTYIAKERWSDAEAALSHAVELSIEVLGKQHPYTKTRIRDLIGVLNKVGDTEGVDRLELMLL